MGDARDIPDLSGPRESEGYHYDLGSHSRTIITSSPAAQTWFNRGLIWNFGFNHDESVLCFERAAAADPDCALAYWGIAYSLGPNYNKPWHIFDDEELRAVMKKGRRALDLADEKSLHSTGPLAQAERGLITALRMRFPPEDDPETDKGVWNQRFASAMADVHRTSLSHSSDPEGDLDVTAVYVDALMNLTPWKLWDIRTGAPSPGAHTLEIQSVLDRALAAPSRAAWRHPAILHLYIHLMEMSGHPEQALPAADALRGLVPDAGHLQHMPSHIDVLTGDYRRAMSSNADAVVADAKYLAQRGPLNFYSLYRLHDFHFRIYAAMFAGQSRAALESVDAAEKTLPEALLRVRSPPMADWLEGFLGVRVHVLVRFGRWADLLALVTPEDADLYAVTTATIHYGRGVAFAVTGRIAEAEAERELFRSALARVPPTRTLFNNTCADILAVASAMLDGELTYRAAVQAKSQEGIEAGFAHLRKAIALDDSLPYDEPWGWMQPTRHAYGALLLEQGRVAEAAAVYAADLGLLEGGNVEGEEGQGKLPRAQQHRGNIWALHGYHECLRRLGGRDDEVRVVRQILEVAEAVADVSVRASCFCRL